MKISQTTTVAEIGALVCEALAKQKIDVILTGGAVVSIYTLNEYQSYDLDFVLLGMFKKVDATMTALGFEKKGGRHWHHPDSEYYVEFPGSTIAIGEELDIEISEMKTRVGSLKLLSPTSSCMDRLAAYFHWNDRQGLDQAVMIAKKHPIQLDRIEKWSQREGSHAKFKEFADRLSRK